MGGKIRPIEDGDVPVLVCAGVAEGEARVPSEVVPCEDCKSPLWASLNGKAEVLDRYPDAIALCIPCAMLRAAVYPSDPAPILESTRDLLPPGEADALSEKFHNYLTGN